MVNERGVVDFDDNSYTENTRAAYPIHHIDNIVLPSKAAHPNTIIFLTADAFGVLPPIAKLTKSQAMYHFLSGFTSKLAELSVALLNQNHHSQLVLVHLSYHLILLNMQIY